MFRYRVYGGNVLYLVENIILFEVSDYELGLVNRIFFFLVIFSKWCRRRV